MTGAEGGRRKILRYDRGYGGIYEEIPFGVWVCNPDGGLRYASDSFLELLGMSMDEARGFGWTERIAQENMGSVERWKQCVEKGQDWDDEHQVRDQQGETRTLLARGHVIRDQRGEIESWIGVHLDITKRKQDEQRVKHARNFAEAVIDTDPEPLIVLDAQHHVVTANPAFCRRFNMARDSTEGCCLYEVGNGQWDIPELRRLLDEAWQQDESFDGYEVEHDFAGIGRKVMLVSGRRVRKKVNRTELIVLSINDITETRQKEDRLRIATEAEAVHQERDRLAHRLHDHVQQLLHAASLRVDVGRAEEGDEDKRQNLDEIAEILQEAGQATRDLAVELAPPVLAESGLLAALEWLADWVKHKHRLEIDLEIEPDVELEDHNICLLLFDTVQELLLNVAKHAGAVRAQIRAERKGEDHLQIVVADEGKGCDPKQIRSQADSASGFGLATIRQRVESVGGTFQFDSAHGQGTTTTIVVPLRQQ